MAPRQVFLAISLVCLLSGASGQGAAAPDANSDDPRCNECNGPSEERDFDVECERIDAEGVYETDIIGDDNKWMDGTFIYKERLTPDIPVTCSLYKDTDLESPIAVMTDTLDGVFKKCPNVISNLGCFLNRALDLPMDVMEFFIRAVSIFTSGCYDSNIYVDDDGFFHGEFCPKIDMDEDLPVMYTLQINKDNCFTPVAGGTGTMKAMLDMYASIVSNINCFLSIALDLPIEKPKDPIKLNHCQIFPRQFPAGFEKAEYRVAINQTSPKGDEYCGEMIITFILEDLER